MSLTLEDIEAAKKLTVKERERLTVLEGMIGKSLRSFLEAGQALIEVRDSGLYRETHATFEEYCRDRWEMSRSRAYQLIDASTFAQIVSTTVDTYPTTERQVRELAVLRDQPEQMTAVWQSATATAAARERPVTTADVRQARKLILGPPEPPEQPAPEPTPLPPAAAGDGDTRFQMIEDAVSLLQALPDLDRLSFPSEQGDLDALGDAIEWLAAWTPRLAKAWKLHVAEARHLRAV